MFKALANLFMSLFPRKGYEEFKVFVERTNGCVEDSRVRDYGGGNMAIWDKDYNEWRPCTTTSCPRYKRWWRGTK